MKCQKCNKREATTHMTKIVNGYKEELHLCGKCAQDTLEYTDIKADFGIGGFLSGIFSGSNHPSSSENGNDLESEICPTCGLTYSEFLQKGKLGCGDCYSSFRNKIRRPLKQIHGTYEHIGKAPSRSGGEVMLNKKIASLESELNSAVLKQDFETAAKLRDEIKDLKAGQEG